MCAGVAPVSAVGNSWIDENIMHKLLNIKELNLFLG